MKEITSCCRQMLVIGWAKSIAVVTFALVIGAFPALAAAVTLGPVDGDGLAPTDLERIKVGDPAPDFILEDEKGTPVALSQFRGKKNVILVFYRGHW